MKLYSFLNILLAGIFAQNCENPFQHIIIAIGQIINDDHVGISILEDVNHSMRANETQPTRNK